jgi:hypothetical protein
MYSNSPLIICQLILAKVEIMVGGDSINGSTIFDCKVEHVKGRISVCGHIVWHHLNREAKFLKLCDH